MSPLKFFLGFCRYAWYRSGPMLGVSFFPLVLEVLLIARYPHLPLPSLLALSLLVVFSLLSLLTCLTFSDPVDIGLSAFPKQLLLLPASSRTVALGPIILGSLLMSVLGFGFGLGVLAPNMGIVSAFWPPVYLLGCLTVFQAVTWGNFSTIYARILIGLLPLAALVAGPVAIFASEISPSVIEVSYGLLFLVGVAGGIRGVERARKSELPHRTKTLGEIKAERPFQSPMEAQVWFEVKRNGMIISVLNAFFTIMATGFIGSAVFRGPESTILNGTSVSQEALIGAGAILMVPLLVCGVSSCCASASDNVTKNFELQPFLALRPMTTNELIQAKMRMAAIVLARSVAISFAGVLILLSIPSPANLDGRPTLFALHQILSWQQLGLFILVYLGFLVGAFKGMISGIWNGIGRLPTVVKFMATGLIPPLAMVLLVGGPLYLFNHPEEVPILLAATPYLLGFCLLIKFGVTTFAIQKLRELSLVESRTMLVWASVWISAGALLVGGMTLNRSVTGKDLLLLAVVQFLALPFGRVALTPILVRANRHR